MPELPEVEYAAGVARGVVVGRTIDNIRVLHPSQRRSLSAAAIKRARGDGIERVDRRGKYQLFRLTSGRTLVVHFRMTGDWVLLPPAAAIPKAVRVLIELSDGGRLALHDIRALSTVTLADAGVELLSKLGPDATEPEFSVAWLKDRFARRRGAIKVALLDQHVVAGVGNIYASEALWYAGIDPRTSAAALGAVRLKRLVAGVRRALAKALKRPERYYSESPARFNVYDREGLPCRRCGKPIRRFVQAARSTYWCSGCQT